MPFPAPIRAVLLDLDGTLLDTETIFVGAMLAALADTGIVLEERVVHAMIGLPGKEVIALLTAELGSRFDYPAFQPIYVAHRTERMRNGIPLKPGVTQLLDRAAEAGLPLVVATSSGRDGAREKLEGAGLLSRFSAVLTRDDVDAPKPHPALFLKAAAAAGHMPAACLAVEDSHVGVRSAYAAGTMTVMVPDMVPCTDEIRALCLHVVPDLHAVRDLLHASIANGPSGFQGDVA